MSDRTPAGELRAAAVRLRCQHRHPCQPPHGTVWEPGPCLDCGTPYGEDIPDRLREPLAAVLDEAADQAQTNELQSPRYRRDVTAALNLARVVNGGDR